jgi:hypothetical protein
MLDAEKFGRGLGWPTNSLYATVGDSFPLDNGLIDIFAGLGMPPCEVLFWACDAHWQFKDRQSAGA